MLLDPYEENYGGRNSYCSGALKNFLGRKTAEVQFLPNHEITEDVYYYGL